MKLEGIQKGTVLRKHKKSNLYIPEGLQEVAIFTDGLAVPIILYITSSWDKIQVNYLYQNIKTHTSKTICEWCGMHHIEFKLFQPSSLIRDPQRYLYYRRLKKMYNK